MGAGVMLKYDNMVFYHNGEPIRIMTIDTVVKIRLVVGFGCIEG
jgi:hypothetical protein